jgi:large repetitive protein
VTSPPGGTPVTGTGTVTVTEGGNPVAHTGGDLSGGATTITIASGTLSLGTHTLVFTYTDTSAIPAYTSSSRTITQVISAAGTTVTFTPAPQTSAVYGTTVDYAGVVTGSGGIDPTDGTVKLYIDSTSNPPLATATLSGANSFSFAGISIPLSFGVGAHTILATYTAASPNFSNSPARTSPLSITQAFTQVSQPRTSSGPGGSNYGQAVTFTVTVTTTNSPGTTPAGGTVSFYLNTGTLLGTVNLLVAAGIASASYTTTATQLPVNMAPGDAITAIYNSSNPANPATANFGASARSLEFDQIVSPAVITVAISSSSPLVAGAYQSSFGQAVTFTAVVTAASGGRPTTGAGVTLIFTDSTTGLTYTGVLDPSRGTATSVTYTVTISTLSVNTHSITATYTDTADNHFASPTPSAELTQIVGLATTSTVLTSLPGPASWATDQPITFTATVTFTAGTGSLLNGSLMFTDTVWSTNYTGTLAAGSTATHAVYTFTLPAFTWAPGYSHTIVATYASGDANVAGNTSNMLANGNVRKFSNLTLGSSADPVIGVPVTFTAVLTGASGAIAGQTVTFTINGTDYTATTGANGVATIAFTFATPGTYTITARYHDPAGIYNDAFASITLDVIDDGRFG